VEKVSIGILSPDTANRPHFKSFEKLLPPQVSVIHEGLGLLRDAYENLAGKTDQVIAKAADFARRNKMEGLILAGGFMTLFNPGLEAQLSQSINLPVASAVSSVTAALKSFSVRHVLLMTPFSAKMNSVIELHLSDLGFTVALGPSFEKRTPGSSTGLSHDELFRMVEDALSKAPTAQAIYFQGATLDPLPILQRLEDSLGVPVIASNPAMLWKLLSTLGLKYAISGYGRLLSAWPALPAV
jgi:maleate cis-trans isomerase